jgi:hypothetical protein
MRGSKCQFRTGRERDEQQTRDRDPHRSCCGWSSERACARVDVVPILAARRLVQSEQAVAEEGIELLDVRPIVRIEVAQRFHRSAFSDRLSESLSASTRAARACAIEAATVPSLIPQIDAMSL